MGTLQKFPLKSTARRITYRFQTHDVRMYYFEDIIRRTRSAVTRAGGQLLGGVMGLPRRIKRWTVLRSPHVNKKSREKFWLVNHRRIYNWDAPANVDVDAPNIITRSLPATVAVRVIENVPGLMALKPVFATIDRVHKSDTSTTVDVDSSTSNDDISLSHQSSHEKTSEKVFSKEGLSESSDEGSEGLNERSVKSRKESTVSSVT